jgi:hypothetical protein
VASNERAEGSRDGRRATSSTSGGCDHLDQRWLRPPRPAARGRGPHACRHHSSYLPTATPASISSSVKPGQDRGTAPQPTTASHHVPRKQGTQPKVASNVRAEGSRDGRRATSSTSGGCDLLGQRPTPWAARLPPPLVVPPRLQLQRAPQTALPPRQDRGTAPQPTTASHHVPRKQGTRPTADRKLRAEGSRDGRRATSSTSEARDLLDQRSARPPRPAKRATSSTSEARATPSTTVVAVSRPSPRSSRRPRRPCVRSDRCRSRTGGSAGR